MVSQRGNFGRIAPPTIAVLEKNVAAVRDQVLTAVPPQANQALRAEALEVILSIVLRDWHVNGNTTGLLASDIADLQSFVSLAASLAGNDLNGQGRPVFLALIKGLLEDWLANWNSPGDPGPPGPGE